MRMVNQGSPTPRGRRKPRPAATWWRLVHRHASVRTPQEEDGGEPGQHFKSKTSLFWLTTLLDRLKQEFKVDVPSVMWDFGAPGHGKVSDQ